jgi:tRNA-dihydrouridine synthase 1
MATEAGKMQEGGVESNGNGLSQTNGKKTKLHGRAFYESIGSPKLVLAPMVEQSEFVRFFSPRLRPNIHRHLANNIV